MAELAPPLYDLHPMRALFMIPKHKSPTLTHKNLWYACVIVLVFNVTHCWFAVRSENFHQFLALCLNKAPKKRPDAKALLTVRLLNIVVVVVVVCVDPIGLFCCGLH